jgi:hypothetical protein
MQIEKKENYSLIVSEETDFNSFFKNFKTENDILSKNNIVISFLDSFQPNTKEINSFLDIAAKRKENGCSFVLVIDNISIDDFPETLNIVPTITEAEDIIEMEDIERELGF